MKHDRGKLCSEFFDCHRYIVKADQFADYRAATLSTAITTAEARHGVVYDATGKILWPERLIPPDRPLPTLASTNAMRPSTFVANDRHLSNYTRHAEDLAPSQIDEQED